MTKHRYRAGRSLSGQVVAITGGARGIGRATAEAILREGGRVAIGDVDVATLDQTVAELGCEARGYHLDVTTTDSFRAFLDRTEAELGPLDVLVNNAGIMALSPFAEEQFSSLARQLDINVMGVMTGTHLALERMTRRNRGHVINIASLAGKIGFPGGATYCATKHAVVGLTEALRAELRHTGVNVTVVLPAIVNTELASGLKPPRFVGIPEAADVGNAIAKAICTRPAEVYVPKLAGYLYYATASLPRKGRELIARVVQADQALSDYDSQARGAYEARAEASPSVEAERFTT